MIEQTKTINAPQPLTHEHDVLEFKSKSEALNNWLKEKALKNERDTARTFVVTVENQVIGYYCLATGSVTHLVAVSKAKRNAPDPIPCMLIARLAVDTKWEGQGIGSGLLKDAIIRILSVSQIAGVRCILVHAKDEEAKRFYLKRGFQPSPIEPLTLMMTLKDIRASIID
ncbi:GNAT family N-acetyltransferase [Nostoc sphaeroides CHAB 2801]|uniref:GNAT family N-acetyltransferase n=1 Tax=Nostoc sphaeroides TaxID=446679 RepID=UPI0015F32059|nr:GNAT family N-acetyltransferase [Nostoc sphaeroides]MCC5629025.1 GNAT family N-acetyltransferase [Nostoc sphaeroides CHAB 2801]